MKYSVTIKVSEDVSLPYLIMAINEEQAKQIALQQYHNQFNYKEVYVENVTLLPKDTVYIMETTGSLSDEFIQGFINEVKSIMS